MDDFASAPAQRPSDDGGRIRDQALAARKKPVRRAPPEPIRKPVPEPEPGAEREVDHQLDVLA